MWDLSSDLIQMKSNRNIENKSIKVIESIEDNFNEINDDEVDGQDIVE